MTASDTDRWHFRGDCADLDDDGLRQCVRLDLWRFGSTRLGLVVEPGSEATVRTWLRVVAPRLRPRLAPTPDDGSGAVVTVAVGGVPRFPGDAVRRAYANQLFYPSDGTMVAPTGLTHLGRATTGELAAVLGGAPSGNALPHGDVPSDAGAEAPALAEAMERAQDRSRLQHAPILGATARGNGCEEACEVPRDLGSVAGGARVAWIVDRYVGGVRQARELQLRDARSLELLAKVVFDLADRPALVLQPRVEEDVATGHLVVRVGVRDGAWRDLGTSEVPLVDATSRLDALAQGMARDLGEDEVAVVSFEPGVALSAAAGFPALLRGPAASRAPGAGGSLLGWYRSSSQAALLYGRGAFAVAEDAPFADRTAEDHAWAVQQLLVGVDGPAMGAGVATHTTRIVPLGATLMSPVTAQATRDAMARAPRQVRVGSLSVRFSMSEAACRQETAAMRQSGLLLVVAASNEHADVAGLDLCPQRLAPSGDLVVVAASDGEGLAGYSNYGPAFVDLAAPGDSPHGDAGQGTSFAAPRVAYAVAQLAALAPDATNAQLRWALMLGVRVPTPGPLPVRSGGTLDGDLTASRRALVGLTQRFAEETARMRDQAPFSVAVALVRTIEGDRPGTNLSDAARRRLQPLVQHRALCRDEELDGACGSDDAACQALADAARRGDACAF